MSECRYTPPNRWGCKPTEDVCVQHDMPLECRHGCAHAQLHACKDAWREGRTSNPPRVDSAAAQQPEAPPTQDDDLVARLQHISSRRTGAESMTRPAAAPLGDRISLIEEYRLRVCELLDLIEQAHAVIHKHVPGSNLKPALYTAVQRYAFLRDPSPAAPSAAPSPAPALDEKLSGLPPERRAKIEQRAASRERERAKSDALAWIASDACGSLTVAKAKATLALAPPDSAASPTGEEG